MIKILKSGILVVLILLCLYQAVGLWTDELESRVDFLPFNNNSDTIDLFDDAIYLLAPDKLGLYIDGDVSDFTLIRKTSVFYDRLFRASSGILLEALTNGELFAKNVDNKELFNSRSLFYTLHKSISKELFVESFQLEEDLLEGIDYVTSFGIILSNSNDTMFIYLLDEDDMSNVYRVDTDNTNTFMESIVFYLDQIGGNLEALTLYDSSIVDEINGFDQHILLPTDENRWSYIEDVYFYTPFVNIDGFLEEGIENYVNGFEPGAKWSINQEDRVLYGNDDTLMSYNEDGVFNYEMFLDLNKDSVGLMDSFIIASSFVQKDQEIKNQEIYLKDYQETDQGYMFFYGYSFNDFPMIMDQALLDTYEMEYPMVVEVKGDEIVFYKRILIAMEDIIQARDSYSGDYAEALAIFEESITPTEPISDMFLGYYWQSKDEASMRWIINYRNRFYSIDL
jgi:hypothetical protein